MEQPPVSERLPRLYRSVLDAVADLEAHHHRLDAAAIRGEATAAYSKAWNVAAERRLTALHTRAVRILEGRRPASGHKALDRLGFKTDLERTTA